MALKEKASELRQQRAKLLDEAKEISERAEKENRALTADEEVRFNTILGAPSAADQDKMPGEANVLARRISQIERTLAVESFPDDHESRRRGDPLPLPHEDEENAGTRHKYSLMKAIRQMASKGQEPLDGLELEVSQELCQRTHKMVQGFMMPMRLGGPKGYQAEMRFMDGIYREKRATGTFDTVFGAGSIPVKLSMDWIQMLRNRMVTMAAGASEILDLQGKFAIPRQTQAATAYWVAENGAPTASNQIMDQVLFTPHTVGAYTDVTRRFFELTILDSGTDFVQSDLTAVIARAADLAALNGSGASGQPLGILQNTGITATRTVAGGTNGLAPTWANLIFMFTKIAQGNAADLGPAAYVTNNAVRGTLANTPKIGTTFPTFMLSDNGTVYNLPLYATEQMPGNLTKGTASGTLSAIICGVWNQLYMAYWSGVDILVDPYTGSNTGTVRVVALQDMDIQVRHNEAFSVIVDMITS